MIGVFSFFLDLNCRPGFNPHKRSTEVKRSIVFAAALVLVTTLLSATEVEVIELEGRVEVRQSEGAAWENAEVGMTVPVGAMISTGFRSSAVLAVGPDAQLNVDSLTRLGIDELIEREGVVETSLNLTVGRVRGEVRRAADRQSDFQLRSPTATASVRGTSFEFDGVNVRVFEGRVDLSNRFNQRASVAAGERSSSTGDDPPPTSDSSREAESSVSIYTAGAEDRTDSSIEGRESDRSTLRLTLDLQQPE